MPVLDTSFLIDLQEGKPEARRAIDALAGQDLVVPGHAVLEFLAGFEDPAQALHFLKSAFRVAWSGEEHVLEGAKIRLAAARSGRRPAWGDVHIAATAVLEGSYVVTADSRDFEAIGVAAWNHREGGPPP